MTTLPAWWLLTLVVPVLWLGQTAVSRLRVLRRLDLPPVIVGGLFIAIVVLGINLFGRPLQFQTGVSPVATSDTSASPLWLCRAWLWLVTPDSRMSSPPAQSIFIPFSTLFFASVGLCASWNLAKRGTYQLILLLAAATLLGGVQNWVGMGIARLMGQPTPLGIVCGSLTLTGGPSTALGWTDEFKKLGIDDVRPIAVAAATFGIVAASLLAGAVGGSIIRLFKLHAAVPIVAGPDRPTAHPAGLFGALAALREPRAAAVFHLVLLLLCVKAGAWVSVGYERLKTHFDWRAGFPVYMGALLTAVLVRNLLDVAGVPVKTRTIEAIAGVVLRIYLAMAIASMDLLKLKHVAGPMAVILCVQVVVCVVFCVLITWPLLGRNYDAAVMTTGHVGFGLGITPNAVASMDRLTQNFGPAPRALLVATTVGGFLIDITNSFLIQVQLPYAHAIVPH